jgi:trimethylamine--corrinoid protein Co-methyltransferase
VLEIGKMVEDTRQIQPLRTFSDGQLEKLRLASLEVLRRTGVEVRLPEAIELLEAAGCWVEGDRVRIPAGLVEWAIAAAPSRVVLSNRDGDPTLFAEGYRTYYGTGSDCVYVIDPYDRKRRKALIEDVARFARVVDALPNIDFNLGMSVANDVSADISDIHQFYAMLTNTTKPLVYAAHSVENLKVIVEMCESVASGPEAFRRNPFAVLFGCSISPLLYGPGHTGNMLYAAGKGLPYILAPSAIAGGTAPMTLPGAMVQMNAEMLAGLVMYQLKREGAPFIICSGCPLPMDMRTTIASYGSPEFSLFQAGLTQLQHYQGLPTWGMAGCTDAKVFDEQASLEGVVSLLMASLSGVNLVHDVGYIEYGKTACFEMLVVMDEMVGMIEFILRGMELSTETLALEVIDRVGPAGEYLTTDHTLRHFRDAWVPTLIGNREGFERWTALGEKTLDERANERAREILETHTPEPLCRKTRDQLRALLADAGRRASKEG